MAGKNGKLALSIVDTHAPTILSNYVYQIEMQTINMFIKRQNKNTHGNFICTCSKLETNQISINNVMNKSIVIYSYNMKL